MTFMFKRQASPPRWLAARVLDFAVGGGVQENPVALFAIVLPMQWLQVPEIVDTTLANRGYVIDLPSQVAVGVAVLRAFDEHSARVEAPAGRVGDSVLAENGEPLVPS